MTCKVQVSCAGLDSSGGLWCSTLCLISIILLFSAFVEPWLERMQLLSGTEGLERMHKAHVLVVGLGGVGGFAAEFLVRAGLGKITIMDGDIVDSTNR